ncbi:GntR family transcriptional regulator [Streptomyces sp. Je 1-79]|uniref:GntR family transcriptional regulator n=1 Tax=Streptomyces sp. Je 1-79 TaxID=2943847 RepID=UPI0021A6027C|nr:GntR family transcriptional regulator [Streptomyces sp. Je 1-79]MCT4357014.1 GntR family transcriptional regulator [Streptomyces sp. Je 1-79]
MAEPEPEQDAAVPLYLKVAAALRGDLAERRIDPGSRLPSERCLAHRYHVNRQTVRSALQLLREERLVVTDRRGTFAAGTGHEPREPVLTVRRQTFPGGAEAAGALVRSALTWEAPPAGLVGRLGLVPGEPTLVHRHVVLSPGGNPMQRSVSWFSRAALNEIPQLARYRRTRGSALQPDLRLLYHWMHQAGLRLTRRESIGVPPAAPAGVGRGAPRLVVHRTVCDQHGHALEITDIDCAAQGVSWTYEFSG